MAAQQYYIVVQVNEIHSIVSGSRAVLFMLITYVKHAHRASPVKLVPKARGEMREYQGRRERRAAQEPRERRVQL